MFGTANEVFLLERRLDLGRRLSGRRGTGRTDAESAPLVTAERDGYVAISLREMSRAYGAPDFTAPLRSDLAGPTNTLHPGSYVSCND